MRTSAGKDRTSGLKCTGLCEWCPVLDRKKRTRGAQKNNSHNILQDIPADRASRQLRHSILCPVTTAKSLVGDIINHPSNLSPVLL